MLNENSEKLLIEIPETTLSPLTTKYDQFTNSSFQEYGGLIIGKINETKYQIKRFYMDEEASSNWGSVQFTQGLYHEVTKWMEKEDMGHCDILGTWHVHPPGFGARFSGTDYDLLFQEKVLLKTDQPSAEFPRIHLIFDFHNQPIEAKGYTMALDINYNCNSVEKDEELSKLVNNIKYRIKTHKDKTGIIGEEQIVDTAPSIKYNTLPYHPSTYRWEDSNKELSGFWRYFNEITVVPGHFKRIFFENFWNHVKKDRFLYVELTRNLKEELETKIFRIDRPDVTNTLIDYISFKEIGVEIL